MKALCIVYEDVHDPIGFDAYRKAVMPTLEAFGARFLVRGGDFTVLEGEMPFTQIAVLEFPSRAHAEGWYRSETYREVLPLRQAASKCQLLIVDGVDASPTH